jgi:phage shock protein PspC (stress-responsive transcriptional regulator)
MTDFTETIDPVAAAPRRLVRRRDERWASGVCSGLGDHFGIDPIVFRIAFAALALAGGGGILLYLAAWLVIPEEGSEESIAVQILRERRDRPMVLGLLIGLGLVGAVALSAADFWPGNGGVWLTAVLAGGALVWWNARGERPSLRRRVERVDESAPPAAPETEAEAAAVPAASSPPADDERPVPVPRRRRDSMLPAVAGVLLGGAGLLGLLSALGDVDVDTSAALAAGAIVAGAGVIAGLILRRRILGSLLVGLLLLACSGVVAAADVPLSAGIGHRVETPVTVHSLPSSYQLAVGDMQLDLRHLPLAGRTVHVVARVGVGSLRVTVPERARLIVHGKVNVGHSNLLGLEDDGTRLSRRLIERGPNADSPTIDLEAFVGVGDLQVRRG